MYSLPRLEQCGNLPVRSMKALLVLDVMEYIASNVLILGVSGRGFMSISIVLLSLMTERAVEVDCRPCFSCLRWPLAVGIVSGKCLEMRVGVRPG